MIQPNRPMPMPGRRLTPSTNPWQEVAVAATSVTKAARTEIQAQAPGILQRAKDAWSDVQAWTSEKWGQLTKWAMVWGAKNIMGARHSEWQSLADKWDPADVNRPDAGEVATAKAEMKRDAGAVAAARAKLQPAQQAQYDAVLGQCAGSTIAQRSLQKLLLDGRLTGTTDLGYQGTLLAHLNALATQPLGPGVDRNDLVAETVSEIETPERIAQRGKGTCGATTAQIVLVRQNPAEYVRLIAGLSSPAGAVKMAGGDTLRRAADWQADNDSGRSNPSRMFQSALMQVGMALPFAKYDNTADKARVFGVPIHDGLTNGGLAKAMSQVTGRNYEASIAWRFNRDEVWAGIKADLAAGEKSIPVSLTWGENGGHFVQVDSVKDGLVTFTNPWGVVQTAKEDEFFTHLTGTVRPGR